LPGGLVPLGYQPPLSAEELQTWERYVNSLDTEDRRRVTELWAQATRPRRLERLAEARTLLAAREKREKTAAPYEPATPLMTCPAHPLPTYQPIQMLPDPLPDTTPGWLLVELPPEAQLLVNGKPTRSTGGQRLFDSPPLRRGQNYEYILQVQIPLPGGPVVHTQTAVVRAGQITRISLNPPSASRPASVVRER
jgi:uncharacterized protein (TIGR03000 family)